MSNETIKTADWIPKNWGGEKIFVNNDKYCGKLLIFMKGKKCSFHVHHIKKESFALLSGKLDIFYFDDEKMAKEIIEAIGFDRFKEGKTCGHIRLKPGDIFEIPTGRVHQIVALKDSELLEFSTHDDPNDSIRLVKGD